MYSWALRGRRFCQVAQKCFCQEYSVYTQHTVLQNNRLLAKKCSYSSVVCKTAMISASPVLENKCDTVTFRTEQNYSSSSDSQPGPELSNKDKLKRAVKDYGATVIVFHVTISLMSLGISYLVISSGVDVADLLKRIGITWTSDIATGASTFVVAYAVHKLFAPLRISITLASTPFIVRYLRRVGVLKPPKP